MKCIVIGSGPGGLTFALAAKRNRADVVVVEKAGDPKGSDAGYTNRSFNLTINSIGRKILSNDALDGSIAVYGRAIHNFQNTGEIKYSSNVDKTKDDEVLMSIPRPILRRNMVSIAEKNKINIQFNTEAIKLHPENGEVVVRRNGDIKILKGDLIVVADGLWSIADEQLKKLYRGNLSLKTDPLKYITINLNKRVAKNLNLNYIHFWHNSDKTSVAIGLPNKDKTISALLVSQFKGVDISESPFTNITAGKLRLRADFPGIFKLDENILDQLLLREQGLLYYKSAEDIVLGDKCIILGDAGSASPPWAGFGANTAIYSADALARYVFSERNNLVKNLNDYQLHNQIVTKYVREFAKEHGEFLSKNVADNPNKRPIGPVMGEIIKKSILETPISAGVSLLNI